MPRTTDVAIVGGGVIGCSIAYYLAKMGISSTVFEQHRFASGASGATAGMISPLWHVDHDHSALFALGMQSLETFPSLAAELAETGIDPDFQQCGLLKVAMTPDQVQTLKHDLVWQEELGIGVCWLDAAAVREIESGINSNVLGGVFSPTEGRVTGQRLVDSLIHAAAKMGATFYEHTEVLGLETSGHHNVTGVRTAQDTFYAAHTVLAAGPWTGHMGRWTSELKLPVRPVKGQRLLLRKAGFVPKPIIHSFIGTSVPQSDGTILTAATRHEGEFDQEITVDAIMGILAHATTILPVLQDAVFVGARAGVRPASPDDVPLIGPMPRWEGLSLATGHNGAGIMLSSGTGQMMADYISMGDAKPLEPFSLARFAANA